MIATLTPWVYLRGLPALLLMAIVFAESGLLVGFFLPGDSLLFLAGALAASNVIGLPIWLLAVGVFVAAVAGDQVGYAIGRRFGPRLFSRPDSRFFSQTNADRAQHFFNRHGAKAVILARFIPVVRTFVPATAGIGRMDRRRFGIYNLVGAALWSLGIVAAGYFFGGISFVAAHIELPEKTYVRAPGDPKTHTVTIIIRDKGRSYAPRSCLAVAGPDFADVLAFAGPSRHYENAPLKHGEFPIPRRGRALPDGRCEAKMTVTVTYRPRYTVGIAQEGQGIPGPEDPHGDTTIVTKGAAQEVVLINYPT